MSGVVQFYRQICMIIVYPSQLILSILPLWTHAHASVLPPQPPQFCIHMRTPENSHWLYCSYCSPAGQPDLYM